MIPYPYNMVDMGGIDLAEANGTVVEGLYSKIVEAVNACGDAVLYNWKFASIEIAPQHTQILVGENSVLINSVIQVTELDEVSIIGLDPPTPVGGIVPLEATENRTYTAVPPVEGFNPVVVRVPSVTPVLIPLEATENGEYEPSDYNADGFSAVSVNVGGLGPYSATHVWTQSTGGGDASINVQEGTLSGVTFTPTSDVTNILYTSVQSVERLFEQIGVLYRGGWIIRALEKLHYGIPDNIVNVGGTITWGFNIQANYIFYFKEE